MVYRKDEYVNILSEPQIFEIVELDEQWASIFAKRESYLEKFNDDNPAFDNT